MLMLDSWESIPRLFKHQVCVKSRKVKYYWYEFRTLKRKHSILGGGLPNYNFENADGLSRRKGQDNILSLVPKGSTPVAVFPPFAMDRIGM